MNEIIETMERLLAYARADESPKNIHTVYISPSNMLRRQADAIDEKAIFIAKAILLIERLKQTAIQAGTKDE